ncbi:hypothetical protein Tco_0958176 [Tanacetum coccineum]
MGVLIPFIVLSQVTSTPAHFDLEIISQTDGAQSSRVPTPLSDDHYMVVRQSHFVDTDPEFGPLKDLREIEIPQPLPSAPSPVPSSNDLHLIVRQAYTPVTIDTESEPEEAPSETEEFEASDLSDTKITSPYSTAPSDSTTPLSSDHALAQTSPAPTRVSYYCTYGRAYSADLILGHVSPNSRGSCLGTSELVEDTKDESLDLDTKREGLKDKASEEPLSLGYEALRRRVEETPAPRPPICDTWVDPMDGTVYIDIPIDVPPVRVPVQTPPSPEWSSGSLPISPSSPVASLATTPATTIAVDKDKFLERYKLRSLEHEQERATVTFGAIWRLVLALESWAGHVDAHRAKMWQARYDDHSCALPSKNSFLITAIVVAGVVASEATGDDGEIGNEPDDHSGDGGV